MILCLLASSLLPGALPAAAEPAAAKLRSQKPWLVELSLGSPLAGAGLYYMLSDHWAIGGHLLPGWSAPLESGLDPALHPAGLRGVYTLSGRYYFSPDAPVSFFFEPSLGVAPIEVSFVDSKGSTTGAAVYANGLLALQLGLGYRFGFGLNLEFSAGLTLKHLGIPASAYTPSYAASSNPILFASAVSAGWAF